MRALRIVLILAGGLAIGCSRNSGTDAAGVTSETPAASAISKLADLKGRVCADMLGTAVQEIMLASQPGIRFQTFNDLPSAMEAVRLGKVDALPIDAPIARLWASQRPSDFRIAFLFGECPYAYFFPKGSPLRARVNAVLERLRESGEIRRIISKWCDAADVNAVEPERLPESFAGRAGVLRMATSGDFEPGAFLRNGEFVGFDIDIVRRIAAELDMRLEVVAVTMNALVPAVQSAKVDLGGGCITPTAARARKVDFSEIYADGGFAIVVRNRSSAAGDDANGFVVGLQALRGSFIRTFVTESRWKLMVRGLGITLLITFLAAVLGTLLAFPVWLARTSDVRFVAACARGYIAVLQGTPVLVLLMVLFYIVFGKVDVEGVWIAVIGFALNASAYISEMIRSGVAAVPRGQTEAAWALGYGPVRTFFRFVLPQAVRAILPVYRGELISLLKSTSVVGYIAIVDLTKASDLVRSRTYESFFPILTTALVYFVIAGLFAKAMERLGRRLDPATRKERTK